MKRGERERCCDWNCSLFENRDRGAEAKERAMDRPQKVLNQPLKGTEQVSKGKARDFARETKIQ